MRHSGIARAILSICFLLAPRARPPAVPATFWRGPRSARGRHPLSRSRPLSVRPFIRGFEKRHHMSTPLAFDLQASGPGTWALFRYKAESTCARPLLFTDSYHARTSDTADKVDLRKQLRPLACQQSFSPAEGEKEEKGFASVQRFPSRLGTRRPKATAKLRHPLHWANQTAQVKENSQR